MAYTRFRNGFNVSTDSAIDRRILLSKAEMRTAETDYSLPHKYFALCSDDGRFYLYNAENTASVETGKYKPLEELIDFTNPVFLANLETALRNSQTIIQLQTDAAQAKADIITLQTRISGLAVDGGVVTSD